MPAAPISSDIQIKNFNLSKQEDYYLPPNKNFASLRLGVNFLQELHFSEMPEFTGFYITTIIGVENEKVS